MPITFIAPFLPATVANCTDEKQPAYSPQWLWAGKWHWRLGPGTVQVPATERREEHEENTKRIRREYEENTKEIPSEYESTSQSPGLQVACMQPAPGLGVALRWLWGGFSVAQSDRKSTRLN